MVDAYAISYNLVAYLTYLLGLPDLGEDKVPRTQEEDKVSEYHNTYKKNSNKPETLWMLFIDYRLSVYFKHCLLK